MPTRLFSCQNRILSDLPWEMDPTAALLAPISSSHGLPCPVSLRGRFAVAFLSPTGRFVPEKAGDTVNFGAGRGDSLGEWISGAKSIAEGYGLDRACVCSTGLVAV